MIKLSSKQRGFTIFEFILVIVVLAIIGTVGWLVYNGHHKTTLTVTSSNTKTNNSVSTNPPATSGAVKDISLTTPSNYTSVLLPVVSCNTEYGAGTTTLPTLPATMSAKLPAGLSSSFDLSVYSATNESMALIAPSKWSCNANIGVDGSETMAVSPDSSIASAVGSYSTTAASFTPSTITSTNRFQLIEIDNTGACAGDCVDSPPACYLFSQAALETQQNGHNCPSKPKGETSLLLDKYTADFADPSGVTGSGSYSGGANPDIGITSWNRSVSPITWNAECILDGNDDSMCAAVMNDVLSQYSKNF